MENFWNYDCNLQISKLQKLKNVNFQHLICGVGACIADSRIRLYWIHKAGQIQLHYRNSDILYLKVSVRRTVIVVILYLKILVKGTMASMSPNLSVIYFD